MKKIKNIIIVCILVVVLTGCGSKENNEKVDEKQEQVNALEKTSEVLTNAFKVDYIVKSFGLPVENNTEPIEKNGKKWYKVGTKEFKSVSEIEGLIDKTYESSKAKEMKSKLNNKYKMIDNELYTVSVSECMMDFKYKDANNGISNLLESAEISKKKITFKYNGKEYTLNKSGDNYLLESTIFVCE